MFYLLFKFLKQCNQLIVNCLSECIYLYAVTKKKPEIDQQLQATQLVETKPGKIVAKVSGEPKPKIQW